MPQIILILAISGIIIYVLGFLLTPKSKRNTQNIIIRGVLGFLTITIVGFGIIYILDQIEESKAKANIENQIISKKIENDVFGYSITIRAKFENLKESTCNLRTRFFNNDGNPLPSNDRNYEFEGQVAVEKEVRIVLDEFDNQFNMFIPFDELGALEKNKEKSCYAISQIIDQNEKVYNEQKINLQIPQAKDVLLYGTWKVNNKDVFSYSIDNEFSHEGRYVSKWNINGEIITINGIKYRIVKLTEDKYEFETIDDGVKYEGIKIKNRLE